MNNKAQSTLGIAIVGAIMFFIIGMMSINFIKDAVTDVRLGTNLNCSDLTISDATKLTCLGIDLVVPYFIVIIISVSFGGVIWKFIGGKVKR